MVTMNDQVRYIYITRQYKFRDAHIYSCLANGISGTAI